MCTWNGSGCTISNLQAAALTPDITAALSNVMSGMMMADQQTASINTSGNSRLGSMINTIGVSSPAPVSHSRFGGMGMFNMMAAQNSLFGMNQFMQCPFNVPYCERTACTMTPLSSSPLERDAFQCYSRPGCCFDEKLFVYRQAFGPAFFRGTPLCYRAIDNPIFNQLTQTSYHPTFLSSIVNTVIQANKNAYVSAFFYFIYFFLFFFYFRLICKRETSSVVLRPQTTNSQKSASSKKSPETTGLS